MDKEDPPDLTLPSPEQLALELSPSVPALATVHGGRRSVEAILDGTDPRFLAIVGPCSIHDPMEALEYAQRLSKLAAELEGSLVILMRAYFEKPRSVTGWKGLILDPALDGSADLGLGLRMARRCLLDYAELGLPAATEFLDPLVAPYLQDLVSYGAIGARTASSQPHRELASGLPLPVGFKNPPDGEPGPAIDAACAASRAHSYPGIGRDGRVCVIRTGGNPYGHLILRGGKSGPNYRSTDLTSVSKAMKHRGLKPAFIVDCSHDNSGKQPRRQRLVLESLLDQVSFGEARTQGLRGFMLESYLHGGSQQPEPGRKPEYGLSITDPCLGWEDTHSLLTDAAGRLKTALARFSGR